MKGFAPRYLAALAPLGLVAFWAGLIGAAQRFPSEYDWRYMTISNLLSAQHNPAGHPWAIAGVLVCGLGGLALAWKLAREARAAGRRASALGVGALRVGSVGMVIAAVSPAWLAVLPKGHEILAIATFLSLCFGTARLLFVAVERDRLHQSEQRGAARTVAAIAAGVALSPVLIAGITQAYLSSARPHLPWVNLSWRELGVPLVLSFALWQWVTCVVFSVSWIVLTLPSLRSAATATASRPSIPR